ncbi:MAG: lipoate--protein ligase [Burkholderiales bacterium]
MPTFDFVSVYDKPLADGTALEAEWMARTAETGRAAAKVWGAPAGLSVPRSYERLPTWQAACQASAAAGWPVQVRGSGGGIVPQGPGVLNLSLVWPSDSATPSRTDAIYQALCDGLAAAFVRLGIVVTTGSVQGSFCDGRFNLVADGRKLVGTAQSWRRIAGVPVVLAHAVILATCDTALLTERANGFEAAAGSPRRYRDDAVTSVARSWSDAHAQASPTADLSQRLVALLGEQFARMIPPLTT